MIMARKAKIVLYNPKALFYTMPLALISLASNLDSQKYSVVIVDARLEKNPIQKLINECKDAICVGFTVLTGDPINDALQASREVKKKYKSLTVIWGGWHPSLFPVETLQENSVDITVQGQGETTFSEIVDTIFDNSFRFENISGIAYKKDGRIIKNQPRNITPMDDLKFQNYELISVPDYYDLKGKKQFDYISSVGCYFRCTFCADPFVYKRRWSALSPERIGNEIEQHWGKYRFEELAFQDETFFTYAPRVESVAEEFLKRNFTFKWNATMRADQGFRLEKNLMKKLVKSGLRWVLIGVESGSNDMLKQLKKDISVEQVLYCAEVCKELGISAHFPIIVGFPNESDESVEESLKIALKLREMSSGFEVPIFYFKPYPGSEIVNAMVKEGYKLPETLEEWAKFEFNSIAGPWVSREKFEYIEKFKFYNRFAGGREMLMKKPIKAISRWRLKKQYFNFPIEKYVIEKVRPEPKLS